MEKGPPGYGDCHVISQFEPRNLAPIPKCTRRVTLVDGEATPFAALIIHLFADGGERRVSKFSLVENARHLCLMRAGAGLIVQWPIA